MFRLIPFALVAACLPFACQQSVTYPPELTDPGTTISPGGGGGNDSGVSTTDGAVGAGSVTVLASVSSTPTSIALDSSNVLWTDAAGNVSTVPRAGGASSVVVNGQASPLGLVASSSLYWANAGTGSTTGSSLVAYSLTASPPTLAVLASNQGTPYGVTTDGTNLYWTSISTGATGVDTQSVPLAGTGVASLLGNVPGDVQPGGVAVDSSNVYFIVYELGGGGSLNAVPRSGGGVPDTLWESNTGLPTDLALSGGILYWVIDSASPNGAVWAVSPSGGMPSALATGLAGPAHLALDAFNVYWTSPSTGQVLALALAITNNTANTPVVVASNLDSPAWIAVDDAIYVTTSSGILRVAK